MEKLKKFRSLDNFSDECLNKGELLKVRGGDNEPPNPPHPDNDVPGPHVPRPK